MNMKRVMKASSSVTKMRKREILNALKALDTKLARNNMFGEIDIYGGAVMCLGLNARESTHDIDAVFEPKSDIRKLIAQVAEENDLPSDWMNDGVKGFVSSKGEFERFGEDEFTNLTIFMTTPEYLFAMKCLSCRMQNDNSTEISDIKFLAEYLGLTSVEDAEQLILEYYPESMYKPKTHYMLMEIFDEP